MENSRNDHFLHFQLCTALLCPDRDVNHSSAQCIPIMSIFPPISHFSDTTDLSWYLSARVQGSLMSLCHTIYLTLSHHVGFMGFLLLSF